MELSDIHADLVKAMKEQDAARVSTLRMLQSTLKYAELAQMKPLDEVQIRQIIKKEIEKLKDSLRYREQAGQDEQAAEDKAAIALLSTYLPAELSDEELKGIVQSVTLETDERDFGPLMGKVMAKVAGRAGGDRVSAMLRASLE